MTVTEAFVHIDARSSPVEWWKTAVVYQIYPRSFADSNGDGIGDIAGITSRLNYIQNLGIDAIWLSPFYPSPLADGGYDVSDYMNVDPRLGSLTEFAELVDAVHRRSLKIIIDIVPNHTSVEHPWFVEALASPVGSAARDRYIFRDGVDGEAPSDWQSHFGGSAWEQLDDGQWYLHLFDKAQPDLNWNNADVRAHFLDVLRFWGNLGVDGFRIDVAHGLAKDLTAPLRSQPTLDRNLPADGSDPLYDRDEVHEIYRSWRQVFDEFDPPRMAVAETWSPANDRTFLYARSDELGQVFDFSLLKSEWGEASYRETITNTLARHEALGGGAGGITWVLSSHDVPRHASRLALPPGVSGDDWLMSHGTNPVLDEESGLRRARAATLMMLALPGSAYLYQGEELGLREVFELDHADLQDPTWLRSGQTLKGRDGCRVPIPWTESGPSYGFGDGGAWLPQPADWARASVQAGEKDPDSTLALYRSALQLRKDLFVSDQSFEWMPGGDNILRFTRGDGLESVTNFGRDAVPYPDPSQRPVLSSEPTAGALIAPETTVWLTRS